jgi:hypothetical protein
MVEEKLHEADSDANMMIDDILKDELDEKHRHTRAVNRKRSRQSSHYHKKTRRAKHYFDDMLDTVSTIFGVRV